MYTRLLTAQLAFGGLLATSLFALGASNPHPTAPPQSNRNARTEEHNQRTKNWVHESNSPVHNPTHRFAERRFDSNKEDKTNENLNGSSQHPSNQNHLGANPNANLGNGNTHNTQGQGNSNNGQSNANKGNGLASGNASNSLGSGSSSNGTENGNSLNGQSKHNSLELLEEASFELRSAYATLAKINATGANPSHSIEKAIHHIEMVLHHHQSNHMTVNRSGVTGSIGNAAHQHHHHNLEEALHEARSAHKQLGMGDVEPAAEHVAHAQRHLVRAISGHQALIGR